ncbi:hypothetical protein CE91St62_07320 [Lachnospiraceae bacterium]|uniref:DUF6465 family protein n=1 Tax=Extibacter sp. GGCC_0201 TaxID=2731209 RepID=UPI001AA18B66|nr:DUF6465 family protein [Extibacter sp. GGCC_0201]MBO1719487.1 hypothetical protein [Extibacter sp. GGCC_0201]BDF32662.1 hypothetical protein CE91St61_07370 [Lachnospiraceae bacterium]BDF36671.1 hypothetical protein CE91St62_07320 [Lachnospiraceae bacterium]
MATKTVTKKQETAAKTEPVNAKAEAVEAETVKKAEPVKAEPVKKAETAKAAPEKKTTARKTAAKKTTAKKPAVKREIKVNTVVEYYGKQVEEKDMVAAVKKAWTKSGRKVGDIKTMELYIKPEEGAVYYVINGVDTGAVAF